MINLRSDSGIGSGLSFLTVDKSKIVAPTITSLMVHLQLEIGTVSVAITIGLLRLDMRTYSVEYTMSRPYGGYQYGIPTP